MSRYRGSYVDEPHVNFVSRHLFWASMAPFIISGGTVHQFQGQYSNHTERSPERFQTGLCVVGIIFGRIDKPASGLDKAHGLHRLTRSPSLKEYETTKVNQLWLVGEHMQRTLCTTD